MKVSIVTPSYNQAAFLEQTIRSVLEQENVDIEYLVMDGGSNDGSVDIIQRYSGQLAGWVSEPDRGQADAVRKGLAMASGDILGWINSDDYYLAGAVHEAVQALQAEPDLGLVFGDVLSIDQDGGKIKTLTYGDWGLTDLMRFRIIGQPSVFFRKEAYEQAGGIDPSFQFLLDHSLWLRIAANWRIRYMPMLWSAARFHAGAKNMAQAAGFGREAYRLVEWMTSQPELFGAYQKNEYLIRAGAYRFDARYLSVGGRAGESLAMYWKSFRMHAPTALQDWKRILVTMLAAVGIGRGLASRGESALRSREGRTHG